jgi:hypothetical protein
MDVLCPATPLLPLGIWFLSHNYWYSQIEARCAQIETPIPYPPDWEYTLVSPTLYKTPEYPTLIPPLVPDGAVCADVGG